MQLVKDKSASTPLFIASWLIAAASIAVLIAMFERDRLTDELDRAGRDYRNLETTLEGERAKHKREMDGALDAMNSQRDERADDATE